MVQEFSVVSDPVMLHIWSCLHNYAYEEAMFTAERLHAELKSPESLYLLATTLYRYGRPKQVSRLLASADTLDPKSRFLLSKCYFDFGLLNEAEEALIGHTLISQAIDQIEDVYKEQSVYALLLLGDVNRRQGRTSDAAKCYRKCLELNPLFWTAFKHLCDLGESVDPSSVFQLNNSLSLPTPTYRIVSSISDSHPTENPANQIEVELISLDGTLNRTTLDSQAHLEAKDASAVPPSDSNFELPPSRPTYVALCSNNDHAKTDEFIKTPQDCRLPAVPRAPKPDHVLRSIIDSSLCHQTSKLDTISPMFGELSLFSQSPMFACVPVFNKNKIDSHLFSSNRSKNVGDTSVSTRHQDSSFPSHSKLSAHSANQPSLAHRKSKQKDLESTPRVSITAPSSLTPSGSSKLSTEQTTTSTPATSAFLRRLIYPTTPNTSAIGALSTLPSTSPSSNSANQLEPPVLRSSSQRVTHTSLPLSTPNSPTRETVSCSPRPSLNSRRLDKSSLPEDELSSFGPRTRSQVAAASRTSIGNKLPIRSSSTRGSLKKPEVRLSAQAKPVIDRVDMNIDDYEPAKIESYPSELATPVNQPITIPVPISDSDDPRIGSLQRYANLLSQLGKTYQLLVNHDWRAATRLLSKLPYPHLATGRVLSWGAQAHMDNTDYVTSHKIFGEARRLEPWQLTGMDLYSTVLWQLQADRELSLLAHDLLELDRTAAEPWCAAGNFFSIQGEHEVSVRFFQRAIQVCPSNAYAFTLLGHEQSTLEEYDKALVAFRHALRLDPRHYNAMFGISNVYYKQEKFELSETHLARAVSLFPNSHLLLTNLAVLRGRLGHLDDGPESALSLITEACRIQPNNPLARYHKSSILFHLGQYTEVLVELKKLLALTPREAMVYLMIGHTYKKLDNTPLAMIHYSWAMGLDPKGANTHLRDIMTNPPVTARSLSRRSGETLGVENNASTSGPGMSRSTRRSRLLHVADRLLYDDTLAGTESTLDPGLNEAEPRNPEDSIGPFNSASFLRSASPRRRRQTSEVSLFFNMEDSDEDGGAPFESMDLGNDAEDGASHS